LLTDVSGQVFVNLFDNYTCEPSKQTPKEIYSVTFIHSYPSLILPCGIFIPEILLETMSVYPSTHRHSLQIHLWCKTESCCV